MDSKHTLSFNVHILSIPFQSVHNDGKIKKVSVIHTLDKFITLLPCDIQQRPATLRSTINNVGQRKMKLRRKQTCF